ncbi:UNVERIFIED_CONTAM: hypothetical protein GTU68_035813 [Idotea baltica]|nr:hypothetical protein [Idotea baltica]
MDGIGVNPAKENNAVALASTPNLDRIYANNNACLIEASGLSVGLPDGQMGNSEVGHLTLGAGTVLKQDLVKITDAIKDNSFSKNEALESAVLRAATKQRPVHLLGLVSDGGVHSHVDHLLALIELCKLHKVEPLVHMITDGRDTAPSCAKDYLASVEQALDAAGGRIATVSGRYYALDRDKRWDRVESAWQAIAQAKGEKAENAAAALDAAYGSDKTDEFVLPTVMSGYDGLQADDEVIFFNFRNDRPREISEALGFEKFTEFDRGGFKPVCLTTMTRYESTYPFACAFTKDAAKNTLGQVVSDAGLKQLRAAETEKYPHVTFFFNGGIDDPLPGEDRLLIDSPKVSTYDLQPEMSAEGIAVGIEKALNQQKHSLIVVNFANGDMVGHTGVPEAVIKSVEVVDEKVGRLWDAAVKNGYSIVLTADHGNADMLKDPISGVPHTQHTTFPVACVVKDEHNWQLKNGYGLPSIAPTILALMGLEQPSGMQADSLLLE